MNNKGIAPLALVAVISAFTLFAFLFGTHHQKYNDSKGGTVSTAVK